MPKVEKSICYLLTYITDHFASEDIFEKIEDLQLQWKDLSVSVTRQPFPQSHI